MIRKSDGVRVHNQKERGVRVHYKKKSNGARVDHEKKSDRVTVHIRKRAMELELTIRKIDGVRLHHERERWGENSLQERAMG